MKYPTDPADKSTKWMVHGGVLQKRCDPGIVGALFRQHLFDFTPLLEQELVLDLVGVIRKCNFIGKILESFPNPDHEGRSRSIGDVDVCGRPIQQKFGRTGSIRGGTH
jgi:hypothetical protein